MTRDNFNSYHGFVEVYMKILHSCVKWFSVDFISSITPYCVKYYWCYVHKVSNFGKPILNICKWQQAGNEDSKSRIIGLKNYSKYMNYPPT